MEKILLAVDGSEKSKQAADKLAEMVKSIESEVDIITVLESPDIKLREVDAYIPDKTIEELREMNKEEIKEKAEQILKEAEEHFKDIDVKLKKIIKYGDPADVICDYAEENDIDMIVLADKGIGGIKRFFLGSITSKVVRHAKSSVMIVK